MTKRSVTTPICILGVWLITYGLWSAWPPLGYMFAGSVLVAFGVFVHRLPVNKKRGEA